MIDVMKRLAELDANNPNIVKESADLAECGMMPEMGGMGSPSTPASINMTAGSGEELGNLLKDIMSLAGVNKVEPEHLGTEHEPSMMLPTPAIAVGPAASARDDMRSVLDKLNPEMGDEEEDEKETVEGQYDNSPTDPTDVPPIPPNGIGPQHDENQPGQGDRMDGDRPKAYADMKEAVSDLFAQYKKFVSEGVDEPDELDQFVNGNRPNFNGKDEDDFDKAQQMFVNFLKKKGINVDGINDEAYPVLVAMCQGKMCAWYDLENATGYVTK